MGCGDNDSLEPTFEEKEFFDVLIVDCDEVDNNQTIKSLVGIAADGDASIYFVIPANADDAEAITITPKTESWGNLTIDKTHKEFDGVNYYCCTLTADESLPSSLSSSAVATLDYSVEVTLSDGSVKSYNRPVDVVRPAAVFAHGLASSSETFDPMLGYIRPMGLFVDSALYALDYATTATDSYATNSEVVPTAISATLSAMKNSGYANKKVTMIGHSMGGILTRLYMQSGEYNDDILKVITIDTPHYGSQLADFALEFKDSDSQLKVFSEMSAIIDLAVSSTATVAMNDSAAINTEHSRGVPVHAITGEYGTFSDITGLFSDQKYMLGLISYVLNNVESKVLYGDDSSDIVVPMTSQKGGLTNPLVGTKKPVTTYSNQWHCSVHTTELAANDIVTLLNTPSSDSSKYDQTGFLTGSITYTSQK